MGWLKNSTENEIRIISQKKKIMSQKKVVQKYEFFLFICSCISNYIRKRKSVCR